jgi:tripartite-type tricarboxylate transporter receptor subunit TctC
MMQRRNLLAALAAVPASQALMPVPALAQAWPAKPIKILVPFVAGGASDQVARAIGLKLGEQLGVTVVVENRPGANGSIAAVETAKSPADGYTLLVGSIGVFAINQSLYKNPQYLSLRDMDPITLAVTTPNVLVAHPKFPANNVKELIEYAKKNVGKLSYASSGSGSSDHLSAELFKLRTKTFGVHIPYRGGAAAVTDLAGGNVDVSFQNLGPTTAHIKAGRLKALAVTSAKRVSQLPDVPTVMESGVPDFVITSWQAVMAPKGLPPEVKARLNAEVVKALNAPDVKARFSNQGFDIVANTPEQYAQFLGEEIKRWAEVVKVSGATVD